MKIIVTFNNMQKFFAKKRKANETANETIALVH